MMLYITSVYTSKQYAEAFENKKITYLMYSISCVKIMHRGLMGRQKMNLTLTCSGSVSNNDKL